MTVSSSEKSVDPSSCDKFQSILILSKIFFSLFVVFWSWKNYIMFRKGPHKRQVVLTSSIHVWWPNSWAISIGVLFWELRIVVLVPLLSNNFILSTLSNKAQRCKAVLPPEISEDAGMLVCLSNAEFVIFWMRKSTTWRFLLGSYRTALCRAVSPIFWKYEEL